MKKQVKKKNCSIDYSKIIGLGMVVIGLIIIALLIVILAKTFRDEKKYTISYHGNDKIAEQMVKQDESETTQETGAVSTEKYITIEKALDVALANADLTKDSVWDIDVELEHKFGQIVYEINFDTNQYEYEYYINAENGEIVKSFREIER